MFVCVAECKGVGCFGLVVVLVVVLLPPAYEVQCFSKDFTS